MHCFVGVGAEPNRRSGVRLPRRGRLAARLALNVAFALGLVAGLQGAAAALEVPRLRAHVNDVAGLLPLQAQAALEQQLVDYEEKTNHQFAVLVVRSLEEEPIEAFAVSVFEKWQLGQKKQDNGLLLVVAVAERKMRIEVGYGLEGVITDVFARQVIDNVLAPAFRRGDFAGGLRDALDLLMQAGRGEVVQLPHKKETRGRHNPSLWLFLLLIFVPPLLRFLFNPRRGFWGGPFGGGGYWGGGGFGGFGGGGGFSGGGGGSGGGGASGGW